MCDFQSGDAVAVVKHGVHEGWSRIPIGSVVNVSEAGHFPEGWGIRISGIEAPSPYWGWPADCFRRVYRPDGSLISKLLEPVDLFSEVRA